MITVIAALDKNCGIGLKGALPWPDITEDLAFFQESTKGSTVIMGRKTFESINSCCLPDRRNVVITASNIAATTDNGPYCYRFIDEAIQKELDIHPDKPIFIIGGRSLFERGARVANKLILNFVYAEYEHDVAFPIDLYNHPDWRLVSRKQIRSTFPSVISFEFSRNLDPDKLTSFLFDRATILEETDW